MVDQVMFQANANEQTKTLIIKSLLQQIDSRHCPQLATEMKEGLSRDFKVEIDLSPVVFIDSSVVAQLMGFRRLAGVGRFLLIGISDRLRKILSCRAPQLLEI